MSKFKKATREKLKLRMAIDGPSGAGKTLTGLIFAFALGHRVAGIDTENRSMSKYQGEIIDGATLDFDVCNLTGYAPTDYTSAIQDAGREGYDVLMIDSLSHAWSGEGGALEMKDRMGGNSFTAWKEITPMHNRMVEAILKAPCHVIVTMRSKTEYVLEPDERGKMSPRKIGMAPVQRPGMEYEFDVYGSMDLQHILTVTKSRCQAVTDLKVVKPRADFMLPIVKWLNTGSEAPMPSAEDMGTRAETIKRLLATLNMPIADALSNLKNRYNVTAFEHLPSAKADHIIMALKRKCDDMYAAPPIIPPETNDEK